MTVDATRETNKQTLKRLMSAITKLNPSALRDELHRSLVFELPYDPEISDCDQDGLVALLSKMFTLFRKFELTITDVHELVDPNVIIALYRGDCEGRDQPVIYRNEYIGVFHFKEGKIAHWREYANPEIAHAAFAEFAAGE